MAQNEHNDDSTRIAEPQAESSAWPAVSVKGLSKRFGPQSVLADVNFDIAGHEMLVVLGPSGSGKTTLLRIIAGLEQPDGGEIFLKGQRVTHFG
ncbi:MAG TPA: ATP-binding cassette domain-containing protein, partial [Pyrinomonadaceae bacterium]|nr:ATP-binding cassette domain-containing protein [Pyrinomonadaceae bacterium]